MIWYVVSFLAGGAVVGSAVGWFFYNKFEEVKAIAAKHGVKI